jgi:hypothetical protein
VFAFQGKNSASVEEGIYLRVIDASVVLIEPVFKLDVRKGGEMLNLKSVGFDYYGEIMIRPVP